MLWITSCAHAISQGTWSLIYPKSAPVPKMDLYRGNMAPRWSNMCGPKKSFKMAQEDPNKPQHPQHRNSLHESGTWQKFLCFVLCRFRPPPGANMASKRPTVGVTRPIKAHLPPKTALNMVSTRPKVSAWSLLASNMAQAGLHKHQQRPSWHGSGHWQKTHILPCFWVEHGPKIMGAKSPTIAYLPPTVAHHSFHMAPASNIAHNMAPTWPQHRPHIAQHALHMAQHDPNIAPTCPKITTKLPQMTPTCPQDGPTWPNMPAQDVTCDSENRSPASLSHLLCLTCVSENCSLLPRTFCSHHVFMGVGWGLITSFDSRHRDYILTLRDLLHTYATLWDLLLYLHTDMMPRCQIFWLWPGGGVG